jgi:hypothetical protein
MLFDGFMDSSRMKKFLGDELADRFLDLSETSIAAACGLVHIGLRHYPEHTMVARMMGRMKTRIMTRVMGRMIRK